MAQGYTQGQPCDLLREHFGLNTASYSTSQNVDSDVFRETANIPGMPARTSHAPDGTAYATQPVNDSWNDRLRGGASPAQVSAGTGKPQQEGVLT